MIPPQDSQKPPSSASHTDPTEQEVRTPPWFTALGIGLFVVVGIGWLMTRPPPPTVEQMRQALSAEQLASSAASPGASLALPERPAPRASGSSGKRMPPAARDFFKGL